jgi:two-component system LytT family response regulator
MFSNCSEMSDRIRDMSRAEGVEAMIKAVLIDDEKYALNALADVLANYRQIEIIGMFTNPMEALEQCSGLRFDVAFLDIMMPGMRGLELAGKLLEEDASREIVFVTAHQIYAEETAKLEPFDFLLKPVSDKDMARAVRKLISKQATEGV